jgi:hypothetical protein
MKVALSTAAREIERWLREVGLWHDGNCFRTPEEHRKRGLRTFDGVVLILFADGSYGATFAPGVTTFNDFYRMCGTLGLVPLDDGAWVQFVPEEDL